MVIESKAAERPARSDGSRKAATTEEQTTWTGPHLLDVDTLSRNEILLILETAEGMEEVLHRRVARTPALRGVTVVNLFYEASTRTRASFELAGKVLGADVSSVLRLLSREFVSLISIAAVISIPVAWMLSNLFLQNFEYRVSLGMGTVVLGLGSIAVIALVSIGSQTLRAALTNPINNLHDD